jgi:hypothetical protein
MMYREAYNNQSNFRTFPDAIIILMQVASGENWAQLMHELSKSDSYNDEECVVNQTYDDRQENGIMGCGTMLSFPYFLSFFILIAFTVMNLSIAAIIDGLKAAKKEEEFIITGSQVDQLIEVWSEYDPKATGWLSVEHLAFLIFELPPPIGLGKQHPESNFYGDKVFFNRQKELRIETELIGKLNKMKANNNDIIIEIEVEDMKYCIHRDKYIFMKEAKMMQILGKFRIPVYKNSKVSNVI